MPAWLRGQLEQSFGRDLSTVQLHDDVQADDFARRQGSLAVTSGTDIYFARGYYRPDSAWGRRLLTHEVAHVVQQLGTGPALPGASLEQEAEQAAATALIREHTEIRLSAPYGVLQHQRAGPMPGNASAADPAIPTAPLSQEAAGSTADVVAAQPTPAQELVPGESLRNQPRHTGVRPQVDPYTILYANAEHLRAEALPAFQQGLDLVDAGLVEEAGGRLLALWMTVVAAHKALQPPEAIRAPDAADLPVLAETRDIVLAGVTIQRFRGEDLLGPQRKVEYATDVGGHIAAQTQAAVATVKDAKELVRRLGNRPLSPDDEEAAITLLAGRPNPWQFAYLRAVIKAEGLGYALDTLGLTAAADLHAILASQEFLRKREALGPADRIGVAEPVPAERKVRVLRPYGGRELALELYGDYAFYDALLVPYNRTLLGGVPPTALVTAGSELLIEPRLTRGRYRMVFMAVEMTKRQADRPYIDADPPGAAILNTKSRYTLRWPLVEPPAFSLASAGGVPLWVPTGKLANWVSLDWYADNDPGAVGLAGVRAEDWLGSQEATIADLGQGGASIDREWPALGTHTVRCKVFFHGWASMDPIELRYPQPVVTEREKLEAEWLTVDDPRIDPSLLMAQQAETYGDFQRIAAELNVTEDELAHDPALAARVSTSYYPEFLVRDLQQQLGGTEDRQRRRKLRDQMNAVQTAIQRTKTWGMRPVQALYVSSDDKRTLSAPLVLYLAPDPEAPAAFPLALRLWDFTLEGSGRSYADGHGAWTPEMAVHGVFDQFGKEAPYPKGVVRFAIESSLLPRGFAGEFPLAREVYEVHTHGGLIIEKVASGLITVMVVGVGALTLGPEVALTAFAIYGAFTGLTDIIARLAAGTFEWDVQTGMDILAIAGGLLAGVSPVISAVRGVGSVAWLGSASRVAGVLQLGVMVGQHLKAILDAIQSGDDDKIVAAVLAAAIDGALIAVTHHAGSAPEALPTGAGRDTIPASAGRVVMPGEGAEFPLTAAGIGGRRPPGPFPGAESAPEAETPAARHEAWAARVAERDLSPRPGPGQPAGPPVGPGTYETVSGERFFQTPEEAFSAYLEALARAGDREVGVFRNVASPSGQYVVRVGDELSVLGPGGGDWKSVLHKHPNPENVLTRRMPAPQDVQGTLHAAVQAGRPVTEFIDYPLPDGRHGLAAYTVEPVRGRVTIKYEAADGTTVERTFGSVEAYASHYSERTTYVDPSSPEYQWIMRDLHDFYADLPYTGGATARGVLRPVRGRAQLDRAAQALEQRIETLKSHPDASDMANELDVIKSQLRDGREADASVRITGLEGRVARAELYRAQSGFERIYGESEQVLGTRVIEYVPKAEGPPLRLHLTAPHSRDVTGQKLLAHVRAAIAEFESEGFTDAETAALRSAEKAGAARSATRSADRTSTGSPRGQSWTIPISSTSSSQSTSRREPTSTTAEPASGTTSRPPGPGSSTSPTTAHRSLAGQPSPDSGSRLRRSSRVATCGGSGGRRSGRRGSQ